MATSIMVFSPYLSSSKKEEKKKVQMVILEADGQGQFFSLA